MEENGTQMIVWWDIEGEMTSSRRQLIEGGLSGSRKGILGHFGGGMTSAWK